MESPGFIVIVDEHTNALAAGVQNRMRTTAIPRIMGKQDWRVIESYAPKDRGRTMKGTVFVNNRKTGW
jgi:hypothetical protein